MVPCIWTVAAPPDRTNPTRSPRAARTSSDAEYFPDYSWRGATFAGVQWEFSPLAMTGREKRDGESSEADTFLEYGEENQLQRKGNTVYFPTREVSSLKIAMSEIQNELRIEAALGDTSSSDESSKDQESIEPIPEKFGSRSNFR